MKALGKIRVLPGFILIFLFFPFVFCLGCNLQSNINGNSPTDSLEYTSELHYDDLLNCTEDTMQDLNNAEIDQFKLNEGQKLAILEPTEKQASIIRVYKQLFPENSERTPLINELDDSVFFVPEEWYCKDYPPIIGQHRFICIGKDYCAIYRENEEFRIGVFDEHFNLKSQILSGYILGNKWDSNWTVPVSVFNRDNGTFIAVEYYSGKNRIYSSDSVIYCLPLLEEVWRDTDLLPEGEDNGFDTYRFKVEDGYFDVYTYVVHESPTYMEEQYKERIMFDSITFSQNSNALRAFSSR
jgi:hypothetical protein